MKHYLIYVTFLCIGCISFAQKNLVADVKIQGNERLKTSFVKKIAALKPGDVLDSLRIEEDMKLLKRMPSISHAYYQVFHSHDNYYNVFYNIEENFTLIPSVNFYTTDEDEFAYRLGLYEFNALGRNIIVGGFYQKDIYDSYALNIRAPFLFSRNLGLAATYQDLTTLEPVFFDNETAQYRYNNKSYELLGLFRFNFRNRVEAGFNYFTEDYTFRGENINNRPELNVKKWLTKFIYEYNNLNYFYQYVSGFRSLFNFQYVTSTDDTLPDFHIAWNDFFYYTRIGKHGNWANRLRLGLSSNDDTPFAPFSVDNNLNIRGVGNTIDRGTGVIVLNTEYRHVLYEKNWFCIQGNAFIDAGTWRNPGGDFGDFGETQNLRVYPGLGVRFIHKKIFNAIFRIDYGHGITEDSTRGFVFGIGQYF
ncbi:outer membrane protein assembly factor [Hyunsoonleella pacifica]|uniref:Outer membrane protein assembly factor n=2 Tax=Hyunsoonleella pacifica TaxID=1080224 RepID=A0A4Q9FNL6_9FLAO|nr:outer membrane protein assembly factor [Hyunsoonleella pacifica]